MQLRLYLLFIVLLRIQEVVGGVLVVFYLEQGIEGLLAFACSAQLTGM